MAKGTSKAGEIIPKDAGTLGTGIAITNKDGGVTNYFVASDGLREIRTARQAPKSKSMTTKDQVRKLLESNNVKFLSKSDVDKLQKKRQEDRANTPDYELGIGTPWGNRGASKRVYRPRRMKW